MCAVSYRNGARLGWAGRGQAGLGCRRRAPCSPGLGNLTLGWRANPLLCPLAAAVAAAPGSAAEGRLLAHPAAPTPHASSQGREGEREAGYSTDPDRNRSPSAAGAIVPLPDPLIPGHVPPAVQMGFLFPC